MNRRYNQRSEPSELQEYNPALMCSFKFRGLVICFVLLSSLAGRTQNQASEIEKEVIAAAQNATPAVIALSYSEQSQVKNAVGVAGTGFFINGSGYFITAAHVLEKYQPDSAQLTAQFRTGSHAFAGQWFDVIEKDEQRDLALCKLRTPPKDLLKINKLVSSTEVDARFAALDLAESPTETGRFVLVAGFPLGSWSPTIQLGTVASTETISPSAGRVPAGQRELLQINVAGNKGNSGSPVIELRTGKVVAVIIQAIGSPLYGPSEAQSPFFQSSGIMLALPAAWVRELLQKHHVKSAAILPTKSLP